MFTTIMADLHDMPDAMRRLAVVQFFSWFALFAMWIYTTAAVTQVHYGTSDPQSAAYNEGANWVGVLFAAYNGFAALAAIVIPFMVRRFGLRLSHLINVWLGAIGLLSFLVIGDPRWLIASMVGVGFAWASILSLPYALLSDNLPAEKMGVYMGIFNFFIVIPQLLAASVLGYLLHTLLGNQPVSALAIGGAEPVHRGPGGAARAGARRRGDPSAGRVTDRQRGGNRAAVHGLVVDQRQQALDQQGRRRLRVLLHGGEARVRETRHGNVVESRDRNVFRHAQAAIVAARAWRRWRSGRSRRTARRSERSGPAAHRRRHSRIARSRSRRSAAPDRSATPASGSDCA